METRERIGRQGVEKLGGIRIRGVSFQSPHGGTVAISPGGTLLSVGEVRLTPNGVAITPIEIEPNASSTVVLESLESNILLAEPRTELLSIVRSLFETVGVIAGTSTRANENTELSRRELVKLFAVLFGLMGTIGGSSLLSDLSTPIATLVIKKNPSGMKLRLFDGYKPPVLSGSRCKLCFNGERVIEFDSDETATVPRGVTGEVTIESNR